MENSGQVKEIRRQTLKTHEEDKQGYKSDFTECLLPNHTQVCANGGLDMITMYVVEKQGRETYDLEQGGSVLFLAFSLKSSHQTDWENTIN